MKKAKLMLSAIAILAVVGGAFAFKASSFNQFFRTAVNGQCTSAFQTQRVVTDENDAQAIITNTLYSIPVAGPCPQIIVKPTT
jgi:hypothetical protein